MILNDDIYDSNGQDGHYANDQAAKIVLYCIYAFI